MARLYLPPELPASHHRKSLCPQPSRKAPGGSTQTPPLLLGRVSSRPREGAHRGSDQRSTAPAPHGRAGRASAQAAGRRRRRLWLGGAAPPYGARGSMALAAGAVAAGVVGAQRPAEPGGGSAAGGGHWPAAAAGGAGWE
mmetsp:Transcript_1361/g.2385  ORF Transcript_1361/g.2385 Transcript_1361/m.2385 type:complete len:140 (-) Transcript_1361:465-884(-)